MARLSKWGLLVVMLLLGLVGCVPPRGGPPPRQGLPVTQPATAPPATVLAAPAPTATAVVAPTASAVVTPPVVAANPTCTADLFMVVEPWPGNVLAPPILNVACAGAVVNITTNAIPNHAVGDFPNARNPNAIAAQDRSYTLTLQPALAGSVTPLELPNPFGIAINGVPLDPLAAEWYNNDRNSGWTLDALPANLGFDLNNAHVQPTGGYHYHGIPEALGALVQQPDAMTLIGFAADGFPVYVRAGYNDPFDRSSGMRAMQPSYRVKSGTRPTGPGGAYDGTYVEDYEYVEGLGDLDVCNGRVGVTPEYPAGIYHYYLTDAFPNIPRCHRGTPDPSFFVRPGG